MIITRLAGGLGNQMFQYAFGRNLAIRNKTILKLDTSWFCHADNLIGRKYSLGIFNISQDFATENDLVKFTNPRFKICPKPLQKFISGSNYYKEDDFSFSQKIYNSANNTYLEGYWQSERYFVEIRELLLKDFSFRDEPDSENSQLLKKIRSTESVSVHIRRGDYVSIPSTNMFHGLCDQKYYDSAIKIIQATSRSCEFFIFSDDIAWVRNNMSFPSPVHYIDNNSATHYEDLRLMINCKHNIIANSSFSWWGAWLNSNKEKIVVAPRKWFNDPSIFTGDLIPEAWIRL